MERVLKELKVIKEELVERGLKGLKGKLEVRVEQVRKEHKEALDQEHKVQQERKVLKGKLEVQVGPELKERRGQKEE